MQQSSGLLDMASYNLGKRAVLGQLMASHRSIVWNVSANAAVVIIYSIGGMHLVPFTPALAEACGCEIIIFAPSVERGWNGSCMGNLPDPLPSRRRHKNGGWKWGWLRQTIHSKELAVAFSF